MMLYFGVIFCVVLQKPHRLYNWGPYNQDPFTLQPYNLAPYNH